MVKKIQINKSVVVEIYREEYPLSPREWDNLGTMACFHGKYDLGDKNTLSLDEIKSIEKSKGFISIPLYLYDHSGITMKTSPFHCPWDSGQVGIIYVRKDEVYKQGLDLATARNILEQEVSTYDDYLTGEVYGYVITRNGKHVDSCSGYYGGVEESSLLSNIPKRYQAKVKEAL